MDANFSIRAYADTDYPQLVELWEPLGLGSSQRGDDQKIIRNTINLGGQLLLLIETKNNKIIGSSWLTIDGRRTYLHHFGIHADYQGKGLADYLLDESLRLAKSFGMQIKLEVHQDNIKALKLYKKSGFKFLGDYDVYIIRDLDTI